MIKHCLLFLTSIVFVVACNPAATSDGAPSSTPVEPAPEASATSRPPEPSPTTAPTDTPVPATATATVPEASPTPAESAVIEDVLYAKAVDSEADDQYLDIYVPESPGDYPVVLWAHGSNLSKASGRTLGRVLAKSGFVVVVIDWRDDLNAQDQIGQFREALEDAECALRLIGGQAGQYGADPERVIWAGFSAGGWLGSLVSFGEGDLSGLWDEYAATRDGPSQRVSCTDQAAPARVSGLVVSSTPFFSDFWFETEETAASVYYLPELRAYAAVGHNPDLQVRLIHGRADGRAVTDGAELFTAALGDAGYDVARFPQAGGHDSYFQQVIEQILALVEE
jgi:acetyl esterase/lipase